MKHTSRTTYLLSEEEQWTEYLLIMLSEGWEMKETWRKGDTFTVNFVRDLAEREMIITS